MPRFFVDREQIREQTVSIRGEDAHHIARSLRMAVGEPITVCDGEGNEYRCRIEAFEEDRLVTALILDTDTAKGEPPCRIRLFQALPKGDKLDTVIQKAVECGACEIVPFESERCVVRVKVDAEARKTERRQRIAEEAAKQCRRSLLPKVRATVDFREMLQLAVQSDLCLFCYEGEAEASLGQVLGQYRDRLRGGEAKPLTVSVVVGSEGGFSEQEALAAREVGMQTVGLGSRILRTETAPIFALSCLVYVAELDG